MTAFVSLFRGINVGGHHVVKMTDLKALHESLGLHNVSTYIQSGNVVFQSDDVDSAHIRLEDSFEARFGFHAEVFVRTLDELNDIIEKTPFQGHDSKEPKWIAVVFLAMAPDETAQAAFLQTYVGPEEIHIIGKQMYVYYPDGMGRSKLTSTLIEKKLKTFGTARNWNTVLQLQKMMEPL